jgi:hypothetical protein
LIVPSELNAARIVSGENADPARSSTRSTVIAENEKPPMLRKSGRNDVSNTTFVLDADEPVFNLGGLTARSGALNATPPRPEPGTERVSLDLAARARAMGGGSIPTPALAALAPKRAGRRSVVAGPML